MGKYSGLTRGEKEALLNTIGGVDVARKLLQGELRFSITEKAVRIVAAVQKLFDKNGRRIKPKGLSSEICDPDKDLYINQPTIDYQERFCFGFSDTGLDPGMSLEDFSDRSGKLLNRLQCSEELKSLLNGPYFPIIIPKFDFSNLGGIMKEFVEAIRKSYEKNILLKLRERRPFKNHCEGELQGMLTVAYGSRYERLLKWIKKESVVGIYFPNVFQGYSVNAQREQMITLPKGLVLSGPLDVGMAFAMYPDVLGRDWDTPRHTCAAVEWHGGIFDSGYLSFCGGGSDACLSKSGTSSCSDSRNSGGLLFVG
jgi:hypothetical protein